MFIGIAGQSEKSDDVPVISTQLLSRPQGAAYLDRSDVLSSEGKFFKKSSVVSKTCVINSVGLETGFKIKIRI